VISFFCGVLFILGIDRLVPDVENPHIAHLQEDAKNFVSNERLKRIGLISALAIGVHNLPEGLATFFSAYEDTRLGIPIAIAVALHNIPEGISVAVPIYAATGSRKKAFWISMASGIAEPVGALLAFTFLAPYLGPGLLGIVLAGVSGVMVFLSVDILVPNAKKYEDKHDSVYGLIAGMAIMAVTLLIV
jgi:ZIP family zinc transporter